jgi:hypothetical protein
MVQAMAMREAMQRKRGLVNIGYAEGFIVMALMGCHTTKTTTLKTE